MSSASRIFLYSVGGMAKGVDAEHQIDLNLHCLDLPFSSFMDFAKFLLVIFIETLPNKYLFKICSLPKILSYMELGKTL